MDAYEQNLLRQLRRRYQGRDDAISDDYALMLIRGWRGEKDAEEIIIKEYGRLLDLRKEHKIDEILDSPTEGYQEFNRNLECGILGTTKTGTPVYYERTGLCEPKSMKNLGYDTAQRCHLRLQEEIRVRKAIQSRKLGRRMFKHVVVLDMKGFGFRHLSPEVVRKMRAVMALDGEIWPGALKKVIVVNTPWLFQKAWSIAKATLHPATIEKIEIVGSKKADILDSLTRLIDIHNIPSFLGGGNASRLSGVGSDEFASLLRAEKKRLHRHRAEKDRARAEKDRARAEKDRAEEARRRQRGAEAGAGQAGDCTRRGDAEKETASNAVHVHVDDDDREPSRHAARRVPPSPSPSEEDEDSCAAVMMMLESSSLVSVSMYSRRGSADSGMSGVMSS